jgi:hypothetical protein
METGPLAAYSTLHMRARQGWNHEHQILAHPAPQLRRRHGEEVTVQMQTRIAHQLSQPSTGHEQSRDTIITGTAWRMTEHGWRASDMRTDRWLSRAICLWQGQQIGKITGVRQVGLNNLRNNVIFLAVTNASDTTTILGCGCRLARRAASMSDNHGHFELTLPPNSQQIIALRIRLGLNIQTCSMLAFTARRSSFNLPRATVTTTVGEAGDLSGGEILEHPHGKNADSAHRALDLEQRLILMKFPIQWHRHPFIGRGWCRHSITAQPID